MKDRIKWCKQNILLKWTETIDNTQTDKGITLNKNGSNSLLRDLNELWDLLDDIQRMLPEEAKDEEQPQPIRVCRMPSQGVWCNECTQFWNCDILSGEAEEQIIYEYEDEEE